MKNENSKLNVSSFGFTTIILLFVMICVVTFSVLSYTTALSDYKLSKKVADKTTNYYEAEKRAYDRLSDIDKMLTDNYYNTTKKEDFFLVIIPKLEEYGIIEENESGYIFSIDEKISENQYLSIKLSLNYPEDNGDLFYKITEWKSIYITDYFEEETLNLMH